MISRKASIHSWKNATRTLPENRHKGCGREGGTVTINEHERVYETLEYKEEEEGIEILSHPDGHS